MNHQRELLDVHELRGLGVMTWRHPDGYFETVCMAICPISGKTLPGDALHRFTSETKDEALRTHTLTLEAARRSEVLEVNMTLPTEH